MSKRKSLCYYGICALSILIWISACSDDFPHSPTFSTLEKDSFATENVVIIVIDGPRYSETWGLEGQALIPLMANELAPQGTLFTNFQNLGPTYTLAGHSAITTGKYQNLSNHGTENPLKPSLFQHYLHKTNQSPEKAFFVTSKAKLAVLSDSRDMNWRGRYNPSINCGKKGASRPDKETFRAVVETLKEKKPNLMLVQFSGPDAEGHANNWKGYLRSIQETDSLVFGIWNYLQKDEHYRNKTALLVTNDHGRHGNEHKDGFVSHGDACKHCRHISLLALGPDFKAGARVNELYEQIDIVPTVSKLLGIPLPATDGKPIHPLLQPEL